MEFPHPSETTLWLVAALFLGLLGAGVWVDSRRRKQKTRRRVHSEIESMMEIIRERNFSEEEIKILVGLVKHRAPLHPLRAITTRHEYDRCVDEEMALLEKKNDPGEFERIGLLLRDIRGILSLDYIPFGQRIHSTREIHTGQFVSVAKADEATPKWMRMIVDEVDEAYFTLAPRAKAGDSFPVIGEGDMLRCRMWRDDDARYVFTTEIISAESGPLSWRATHTRDLKRVQARSHFRIRHDQTSTIAILNGSVDGNMENVSNRHAVTKMRGRITSISAGGCALVIQQPVSKQVLLRISLDLPGGDPVPLEARIVATAPISGGRHLVRASFVGLDDTRRDRVAKYVLHRQQHTLSEDQEVAG